MMQKKGFTLIEVLLVVIIIGILAAITLPRMATSARQARIEACNANRATINSQLERWNMMNGAYPTLTDLFNSEDYYPEGASTTCPLDSTYVLGANNRVTAHVH